MDEPNTTILPINEPVAQPDDGGGPSGMWKRWEEMKATDTAEPKVETNTDQPVVQADPNQQQQTTATSDEPAEPKARAKWGELKKAKEEYEEFKASKLPAMEAELKTLREKAEALEKVDPTRYEAQIKEKEAAIADYEKKLAVFDVRQSKVFQEQVLAPMTKIGSDMDRLAATYGVSPQALKDALTITDPKAQLEKITELTGDFTDLHKNKLWSAVEQTQDIYAKAAELEANAQEAKKEMEFLQHQEKERQNGERQKVLAASAEAVKKQLLTHLPMLANEEVSKDVFSADLKTEDPTMLAYNAFSGRALAHVTREIRVKEQRIKELEGELAKRVSVTVKAGGGTGTQQQAAPSQQAPVEGESTWQRWKNWQAQRA